MVGQASDAPVAEPTARWNALWSALFYGLLSVATFNALVYETHAALTIAFIGALVVALASWHGLWRLPGRGPADRSYFVVAAILWAGLMLADPDFLILSLGIFAPLCLHDVRWGAAALVGTGAVWLWLEAREGGGIVWGAVLGVVVFVAAGLLLVGYFATVVRQSRRRQELIDELRTTRAELAAAEREAGVLTERQRLARDIHDTLTQGFASVVMLLEAAAPSLPSDTAGRRHVERALDTARENLVESRRLVWAMRPASLTDASLPEALHRLAAEWPGNGEFEAATNVTGSPFALGSQEETAVLRVAQEALSNARRHAGATRVTVTLSYMDKAVTLDVQDDGSGFRLDNPGSGRGVGLRTMRERAEALGGSLIVETSPGEGTTVALELPVPDREPDPTVQHQQ